MIPLDSAWNLYIATRLHYLKGFDAVKYKGKFSSSGKAQQRPDKVLARGSLTGLGTKREAVEFCVANFLHENDNFLYDSQDDAMEYFMGWNKYWKTVNYFLPADISTIEISMLKKDISFEEYMIDGIFKDVLAQKIRRETLCVIHHQLPHALVYMNGFGADRLKDRVIKTNPFIHNRLNDIKISIKEQLDA